MKRLLRISVVLTIAILVMLAGLTLGTRTAIAVSDTSQLSIQENAQFVSIAVILVQVNVKCSGGTGTVNLMVMQTPAQSSNGVGASGSGSATVNCDGSEHKLNVSISALTGAFSLGDATAQGPLLAPSGIVFDIKTIHIVL